ncbi:MULTISPECIES: rhombosortase [unclassified Microbulbifer]|uniref:rhombosortase n=1 Tax=unclassified Microbulbifer TaxID=2619833 RepID=UPI0027E3C491|nr:MULTISPECIES: rhombosortase [unclassified Microbulbifer]
MRESTSITIDGRGSLATVSCVLGIIVSGWLLNSLLFEDLGYNRTGILEGEVWRLLSSNFLHTNAFHMLLNGSGLLVLWFLHGNCFRNMELVGGLLFISLLTTTGLFLFERDLIWYVGLSGALHGLVVWGCFRDFSSHPYVSTALLACLAAKLFWETDNTDFQLTADLIEAPVVTAAHLWGSLSGVLIVAVDSITRWCRQRCWHLRCLSCTGFRRSSS